MEPDTTAFSEHGGFPSLKRNRTRKYVGGFLYHLVQASTVTNTLISHRFAVYRDGFHPSITSGCSMPFDDIDGVSRSRK
jgi:hypothetical protein